MTINMANIFFIGQMSSWKIFLVFVLKKVASVTQEKKKLHLMSHEKATGLK